MNDALAPGDRRVLRTLSAHGATGVWTLGRAIRGGRAEALEAGRRLVALGLAEERAVSDGKGTAPAFVLTRAGRAVAGDVVERGAAAREKERERAAAGDAPGGTAGGEG